MYRNKVLRQVQELAGRLARAEALVGQEKVEAVEGLAGAYIVANGGGDKKYLVQPDGRCTCSDWQYRREETKGWCKHRLASLVYEEQKGAQREAESSSPEPQTDAGSRRDGRQYPGHITEEEAREAERPDGRMTAEEAEEWKAMLWG